MASKNKPSTFTYPDSRVSRVEPPPDKKRRTDYHHVSTVSKNIDDDLWGDELDSMTKAQFEDIDLLSQQPSSSVMHSNSNRMVGRGAGRSFSEGNMQTSSQSSPVNHAARGNEVNINKGNSYRAGRPSNQTSATLGACKPSAGKTAKVGSENAKLYNKPNSKVSMPNQQRTHMPHSLTSKPLIKSQLCPPPKFSSIKSSSSSSSVTSLTGSTGSGRISPSMPASGREFTDLAQEKIAKLENQVKEMKEQNEKANDVKNKRAGEVELLRSGLQETKQELSNAKQEQIRMIKVHKTVKSEKEQSLFKEVARLKTQILFSAREHDELQEKCQRLEKQSSAAVKTTAADSFKTVSPVESILKRKIPESSSPSARKGAFPNCASFMAEEMRSDQVRPRTKPIATEDPVCRNKEVKEIKHNNCRRFPVKITNRRGRLSGPRLVSMLLPKAGNSSESEQGIVGLLQVLRLKHNLPSSTPPAELDATTEVMHTTNRWIQTLHQQSPGSQESDTTEESLLVVPRNYHAVAVHAICNLLQVTPPVGASTALLPSDTEKSMLLLPIIDSYLLHYQKIRASESIISNLSSLANSMDPIDPGTLHSRSPPKEDSKYSHQVEQWALNALYMLCILVDFCPQVRLAILGTIPLIDKTHSSKELEKETSIEAANCESFPQLTSDLNTSHILQSCQILEGLMATANPEKLSTTDLIEVSLEILSMLAAECPIDELIRFEAFLGQEILQMCLIWELSGSMEQRLRCHLHVVDLAMALSRSEDMLAKLCTCSEDCLLLTMYTCVSSPHQGAGPQYRILFGLKLIEMLTSAVSYYVSGMVTVLKNDCQCGCEVVKTVTQLLYHGLHEYRKSPSSDGLCLLQQGAVVLSMMAQCDRLFTRQRRQIENLYIEVVIGLHVIFKELPDCEEYDEVLQTLWDFDVEYSQDTNDTIDDPT